MIYADHGGLRTDSKMFDEEWLELFEEQQEGACRLYGKGAAFTVECTHNMRHSYERKKEPSSQ